MNDYWPNPNRLRKMKPVKKDQWNSLPALDLPCKIVAGSGAGKLDFAVQGSVAEEITEVLEELQELI